MDIKLKLADLVIGIEGFPYDNVPDNMKPFVCDEYNVKSDFQYNVSYCPIGRDAYMGGDKLFENNKRTIYKLQKKYFVLLRYSFLNSKEQSIITMFDVEEKRAEIHIPKAVTELSYGLGIFMDCLDIDLVLLLFNRIIMHASVVKYHDRAILFSGPSGIGKSTQANLWKKYMNADILNGDRATIDISKDIIDVYGSPYAGSSKIYRNESAPLEAIVLLKQGKENSIRQLEGMELYRNMYPRFSFARWDDRLSDISMNIMEEIISRVPVYELTCLPDEGAVKLVRDTIF